MRLKVVPSSVECPHPFPQAFNSSVPRSFITSCSKKVSQNFHSDPLLSKNLLKSQSFNKIQRSHTIRRSFRSNLDELYREEQYFYVHGLAKSSGQAESDENKYRKKKVHFAISEDSPFMAKDQDLFLNSRMDFLEPMILGIKPEFADRPDQETVVWATIEQKAKSLGIPLSLRMIKKKLQLEEGLIDSSDSAFCSVKAAFASMVSIIVELQSHALEMREALCKEDLEIIISKVQKEMHSSFVWLFQQVFSRTPDLMLHVMVLLADFSVHSTMDILLAEEKQIQNVSEINSSVLVARNGNIGAKILIGDLPLSGQNSSVYQNEHIVSTEDMKLWNSMVDEASNEVLDHEVMQHFVSPVKVEIEPDGYEDYLRTDLLYQMNLALEPNNPLLLCNYAQFLQLVSRDYDRAEECLKRAVQVLPPDAESLNQYANFLWTVRKDFWAAEERFLQALAAEPDNSYYAGRYANFLWSSGGEETCFPLNNSQKPNL